ncbi:MAG: zinc-binding dehydrogenase [Propionibacterium sp.]|nr:zinc-binding dehydrogenase [Propionibacterium sp.]
MAALVDDGRIHPAVTTVLEPISAQTLREAHSIVEGGRTLGKVVLRGWE